MRPTRAPTRHERLVNDLSNAAIDLQSLAQRLANSEGLSVSMRAHAFKVAEAGRAACLAAVTVNEGHHTDDLVLHYGQWLTSSARKREALDPLAEEGMFNKYKPERPDATRESLAVRRAKLHSGEPVPPAS